MKKLGKRFSNEFRELDVAYFNNCGNASAFLLRKILEKSIFLAFAKNKKINILKEKNSDKFVGLEKMISIASKEFAKDGTPFILPKVAEKLSSVKFLGDTAAHDFIYDIDIKDIERELSVINIGLGQLANKL